MNINRTRAVQLARDHIVVSSGEGAQLEIIQIYQQKIMICCQGCIEAIVKHTEIVTLKFLQPQVRN